MIRRHNGWPWIKSVLLNEPSFIWCLSRVSQPDFFKIRDTPITKFCLQYPDIIRFGTLFSTKMKIGSGRRKGIFSRSIRHHCIDQVPDCELWNCVRYLFVLKSSNEETWFKNFQLMTIKRNHRVLISKLYNYPQGSHRNLLVVPLRSEYFLYRWRNLLNRENFFLAAVVLLTARHRLSMSNPSSN